MIYGYVGRKVGRDGVGQEMGTVSIGHSSYACDFLYMYPGIICSVSHANDRAYI